MEQPELQPNTEARKTRKLEDVPHDPIGYFLRSKEIAKSPELESIKPAAMDFSYLSPAQRAESLWATFQDIKRIWKERTIDEKGKRVLPDEAMERVRPQLSILKALYKDAETKETYIEANQEHLQEIESINGDYEKYEAFQKQIKEAERAVDASARNMFTKRGKVGETDILLYEINQRHLLESQKLLRELVSHNPELGSLVQYQTLKEFGGQLRQENFIWTPSRRELLDEIERAALSGSPVLLSGESGTGKTRLVEQASLALTGQLNNETPGKDVRFQDLIARPKISADGETYYEYKEIGEAATGKTSTRELKPEHQGRIVADDEFNLLPRAEQTERLARIAAWTPGKKVRMPVTNEEVTIAPNFLYCAMVNLASERYTREKIPPEVLRKFAKVDVDYPLQTEENPEIYEMMLAACMDENGRVRVAREELTPYYEEREEVDSIIKDGQSIRRTLRIRELRNERTEENRTVPAGGFLWRLSNAIGELNKSFSHRDTVLKSKGEAQFVKDLVIDMGTILGWLREYGSLGRGKSLEEFTIEKLNSQFLTKAAYSADDRQLVKDFLRHYGIDAGKQFDAAAEKPPFEILTPSDVGLLSPRLRYYKVLSSEPVLAEASFINGEGERVEFYIRPYEVEGVTYTPGQILKGPEGRMNEFLGITKDTGEPVITPYKEKVKKVEKKEKGKVTESQAEIIMGKYFLGRAAVQEAFGIALSSQEIPSIPFSKEELEHAKELGQSLILRIDKAPDGTALTMKKMNEFLAGKFKKAKDGKILFDTDWYKNEEFFTTDTPKVSWVLASREVIPGSTSKDYWSQTEMMATYLQDKVFEGVSLPTIYQEAWDEWQREKAAIQPLVASNWQEAARRLGDLKINQLLRQTPAEALYDNLILFQNTKERSLEAMYTWTSHRSSDGNLVNFGNADAEGANVNRWKPDGTYDYLGVVLSRSL